MLTINETIELLHIYVYGEVALHGKASKTATDRLRKRGLINGSPDTGTYELTKSGQEVVDRIREATAS